MVELLLIFDGASYGYMVLAVAPIGGQSYTKTVDALGGDNERQVAATTYHVPGFGAPWVGFGDKEIGGKAGIDPCARRYAVVAVATELHRQVEGGRAGYHIAVLVVKTVASIDVAVPASFADLVTTMPQIPHDRHIVSFPFPGFQGSCSLALNKGSTTGREIKRGREKEWTANRV